jgi:hypothetical protein
MMMLMMMMILLFLAATERAETITTIWLFAAEVAPKIILLFTSAAAESMAIRLLVV